MAKSIQVSEEYHAYVKAHNREGETMEETLRRLSRMPDPREFGDLFSSGEVDEIEAAIEELNQQRSERLRDVREAFTENE
jgi:hypothetical protein